MYAFDEMAKELSGVRARDMLLLTLVCFLGLSNSADILDEQTAEAGIQSSEASLFHRVALTEKQSKSIVTIEFNCTAFGTGLENRTTEDRIYRNVHFEILKTLRLKKSNISAKTFSTSSADDTSAAIVSASSDDTTLTSDPFTSDTTDIFTIFMGNRDEISPPELELGPLKRRKREQTVSNGDAIDANDLRFVEVSSETDDNGICTLTLLLIVKGLDEVDAGILLLEAANQTYHTGNLVRGAGVPVVTIYSGPPMNRTTMLPQRTDYKYLIWPLVILLVVMLFIVVGIFIYYTKKNKITKLNITEAK